MHAQNLLKAVLEPRSISSGQTVSSKDSKSRGSRATTTDSGLSLSVTKKSGLSPIPKPAVKMSCLCAPTNHAGSFRCRLHRGNQQSWGGRAVPARPAASAESSSATSPVKPAPVESSESASSRHVPHQLPSSRQPMVPFASAHRISEARPSRLSRVSAASDVPALVAQGSPSPPSLSPSPPATKAGNATLRYTKFNPGAAASCGANGAVIDGGMSFVKKLQTGGKDVLHEVFGSGTAMSRAALSL